MENFQPGMSFSTADKAEEMFNYISAETKIYNENTGDILFVSVLGLRNERLHAK